MEIPVMQKFLKSFLPPVLPGSSCKGSMLRPCGGGYIGLSICAPSVFILL